MVPHLRRRHPGALLHHRPGRRDHRRHQGLHAQLPGPGQRPLHPPGRRALHLPQDHLPQSGQPTGQRVHKPVVITKVFDKASPLLLAALTSGERLTKVEIQWYRTSAAGTQEHYYTTVLEDAIIVDIKDYMHNCQDPGNAHFTHLEDVHFTYRKITWTHEVSGTSGSDDWRSPVAG
ncbi:hypothetical protein IPC95_14185 [Pseudomonas aeruginosa]|nr:hypothetical protein IPC95_14185 [Pseudomonas aeruginosa]